MLTNQKLKDILKYVWNPKIDLTNSNDVEKLNQLIEKIYDLLDSRYGSKATLNAFLKEQSVQYFSSEVTEEKSLQATKLITDWYSPQEAIWTDYGRVKIQRSTSRFFDQDYFVYQSDTLTEYIGFNDIAQNEVVIHFAEIELPEIEKTQLLDAIRELIRPSILTDFDPNTLQRL